MQRQGSFSQAKYAGKKKQARRDKFLAEMEQVVPWARLVRRRTGRQNPNMTRSE
jgi:IS5 family transposase